MNAGPQARMNRTLSASVYLLIVAAAATTCSGGVTLPEVATPEAATPVRVTLPPARTAPPAAVLAARQTAALWPPIEVVAVGAGADLTDWQTIEFGTGSFRVPSTFEVADRSGFDDVIVAFMRTFASSLVRGMEGVAAPG